MARFIKSYNSLGAKPAGVNNYRLQAQPPATFGALLGLSYKHSRNLVTIPISLGQTVLASKGTGIPKASPWVKSLDYAYAGIGVGYMGYLHTKKFKGNFHFPKVMYHLSLNAEKNRFVYTDKGGANNTWNFVRPSIMTFIQYNVFPPANGKTRVALGVNVKYHTTLTPINLGFLQTEFDYRYGKSLMSRPDDISLGVSLIFLGRLNRHVQQPHHVVRFALEDDLTSRKVNGRVEVRIAGSKKVRPVHHYFNIKKQGQQFPVLFVKTRARGYFAQEKVITLNDTSDEETFNIRLKPIHPEIPLKTIYFNHATTNVADSSYEALEAIYKTLLHNPELTVVIRGNTSSEGSGHMNLILSRKRAGFVKDFLVGKKIARHRIRTIGLGAQDPVWPDDTEQHRAQNRRAEVFIVQ